MDGSVDELKRQFLDRVKLAEETDRDVAGEETDGDKSAEETESELGLELWSMLVAHRWFQTQRYNYANR